MPVKVADCYVTDIDTKNKGYSKKLEDGSTQNRVKTKQSITRDCKRIFTPTEQTEEPKDLEVIGKTEEEAEEELEADEEQVKQAEQPTMAKLLESFRRFASDEKPESKYLEKEKRLEND